MVSIETFGPRLEDLRKRDEVVRQLEVFIQHAPTILHRLNLNEKARDAKKQLRELFGKNEYQMVFAELSKDARYRHIILDISRATN